MIYYNTLNQEHNKLKQDYEKVLKEKNKLSEKKIGLSDIIGSTNKKDPIALEKENKKYKEDYKKLENDYNQLIDENDKLKKEIEDLKLKLSKDKLKENYNVLNYNYNSLVTQNSDLKKQLEKLKKEKGGKIEIPKLALKSKPDNDQNKKVQLAPSPSSKDSEKKDIFKRTNKMAKSVKVTNMAKQLEEVLNKAKTNINSGSSTARLEVTPIIHEKVDLTGENNAVSLRSSKKKKKSPIIFEDN